MALFPLLQCQVPAFFCGVRRRVCLRLSRARACARAMLLVAAAHCRRVAVFSQSRCSVSGFRLYPPYCVPGRAPCAGVACGYTALPAPRCLAALTRLRVFARAVPVPPWRVLLAGPCGVAVFVRAAESSVRRSAPVWCCGATQFGRVLCSAPVLPRVCCLPFARSGSSAPCSSPAGPPYAHLPAVQLCFAAAARCSSLQPRVVPSASVGLRDFPRFRSCFHPPLIVYCTFLLSYPSPPLVPFLSTLSSHLLLPSLLPSPLLPLPFPPTSPPLPPFP